MVSQFILSYEHEVKKAFQAKKQTRHDNGIGPGFAPVVNAFVQDKQVTRDEGKGFGSGALKVNGKIFAMMTSLHKFVFKLAKDRVDRRTDAFAPEV